MLAPSDRDRLEAYQLFAEKSFILLTLALKQRRLNDEEKWLLCAATETVAACEAKEESRIRVKAGSLRINCPESTNRVVLDITANDEPPIRIVKHGEKGVRAEAINGAERETPSAVKEALAGIRETMMSETEADAVLAQHVKGYAVPRTAPQMTDGDLGIKEASVSSGSAAGAEAQPSGSPAPQPHAEPVKADDKQEPPASIDRPQPEIHHVTNIVIERKAASPEVESITWLNRELAWVVIFLWLLAFGIGATAAIIFAIGIFNKVAA
jgi:hypothetical protein